MKLIPAPVISCSCILQPAKQTCRRSGCSTSSPTLTPAPTVSRAGHACPPAHRCACDQLRYSCWHLKLHFDTPDAQPSESLSLLASSFFLLASNHSVANDDESRSLVISTVRLAHKYVCTLGTLLSHLYL